MNKKEYTALPDGLYSAKEIYENFLHVSREAWEKQFAPQLHFYQVGRVRRYYLPDVKKFLNTHLELPKSAMEDY